MRITAILLILVYMLIFQNAECAENIEPKTPYIEIEVLAQDWDIGVQILENNKLDKLSLLMGGDDLPHFNNARDYLNSKNVNIRIQKHYKQ